MEKDVTIIFKGKMEPWAMHLVQAELDGIIEAYRGAKGKADLQYTFEVEGEGPEKEKEESLLHIFATTPGLSMKVWNKNGSISKTNKNAVKRFEKFGWFFNKKEWKKRMDGR